MSKLWENPRARTRKKSSSSFMQVDGWKVTSEIHFSSDIFKVEVWIYNRGHPNIF